MSGMKRLVRKGVRRGEEQRGVVGKRGVGIII